MMRPAALDHAFVVLLSFLVQHHAKDAVVERTVAVTHHGVKEFQIVVASCVILFDILRELFLKGRFAKLSLHV